MDARFSAAAILASPDPDALLAEMAIELTRRYREQRCDLAYASVLVHELEAMGFPRLSDQTGDGYFFAGTLGDRELQLSFERDDVIVEWLRRPDASLLETRLATHAEMVLASRVEVFAAPPLLVGRRDGEFLALEDRRGNAAPWIMWVTPETAIAPGTDLAPGARVQVTKTTGLGPGRRPATIAATVRAAEPTAEWVAEVENQLAPYRRADLDLGITNARELALQVVDEPAASRPGMMLFERFLRQRYAFPSFGTRGLDGVRATAHALDVLARELGLQTSVRAAELVARVELLDGWKAGGASRELLPRAYAALATAFDDALAASGDARRMTCFEYPWNETRCVWILVTPREAEAIAREAILVRPP